MILDEKEIVYLRLRIMEIVLGQFEFLETEDDAIAKADVIFDWITGGKNG